MPDQIFPPGEPPAAAQPATERAEEWLKRCMLARGSHPDGERDDQPAIERAVHRILGSCSGRHLVPTFVEFIEFLHPPASAVSPTLKDLAARLGWGNNMAASDVFNFVCEREQMLRVAQDLLETHKSAASTAEAAIRERIAELKASAVSPREEPKPKTVTLTIHGQTTNGIDWKPAEASVPLSPEIPQRFTLVRETRQGGHYGEEQYEHVSMEPSPMGEWVKYEPLWDGREQLSPFRLSPEGQEKVCSICHGKWGHCTCANNAALSPTPAPLKELIERRLELSEELRNGLAGVIAKQDEELKLLRAKVSALSPHPPTSEERFALDACRMVLHWYESDSSEYNRELAIKACRDALSEDTAWKCKARAATDPPQDCDWPCCGCDPHADKVIAALEESGKLDGSPHPPTSEEHFWEAVANGWDIEPREYFEREAVAMGFKSPVEMAVHHMWKRHAKDWPNAELKLKGSPHPPSEERT